MGLFCFVMWVMRSTYLGLNWNCLGNDLRNEIGPFDILMFFAPIFVLFIMKNYTRRDQKKYIDQDTMLKIKLNIKKRRLFVRPMLRILKRLPRVMNVIKHSYHCHFCWPIICTVMFLLSKSIMVIAAFCLLLQDRYRRVVLQTFQSLMHFCIKHCAISVTLYFSRCLAI